MLSFQVMVIIKRDDYISFINSTGVKMPTTPANDISTQPPGNGGTPIPPNNNINTSPPSNQAATISTIKRDSSQQQLQQLQQYSQQQQSSSLAKAQLVCRPNSHPFPVSRQSLAFCALLTNVFYSFRAEIFFSSPPSR